MILTFGNEDSMVIRTLYSCPRAMCRSRLVSHIRSLIEKEKIVL